MNYEWFILQILSGKENIVKENIEKMLKIYDLVDYVKEVIFFKEKYQQIRKGEKVTKYKKLFPGYLFIHIALFDDEKKLDKSLWNRIRYCEGVINFLGKGHPNRISQKEIIELKSKVSEAEETNVISIPFKLGEKVKIKNGPFESYEGEVSVIDKQKGRLQVNVNIFDRLTPVDVEYWQVEKV